MLFCAAENDTLIDYQGLFRAFISFCIILTSSTACHCTLYVTQFNQDALLLHRDSTTLYNSRNLVNCCTVTPVNIMRKDWK